MKDSPRILVVDDARETVEVLRRNLEAEGYEVSAAASAIEAIRVLEARPVDLVVTDYRMPGVDGMDLIRHVTENYRDVPVVMITGYGSIGHAVEAVKAGAIEYLPKPFTDSELADAVQCALARRVPRPPAAAPSPPPAGIVGNSPAMRSVYDLVDRASRVEAPVLITGESGTGKELVARAIHYTGSRAAAPFVAVNCGAIPEPLFESELFGHLKGAFTGADQTRAGYFQTAEGGTIFLDEVGELAPGMQVKLLRAVQEREVAMVGSRKPLRVDVRIIASTNRDISALVSRGLFREDLYWRLNVIAIELPPLRDRPGDLPLLVRHFISRWAREYGKTEPEIVPRAMDALSRHDWPGNVRELENAVQRLVLLCDGPLIDVVDLPASLRFRASAGPRADRTLAEVEAEHIALVVEAAGGNISKAASTLGIDRKTLSAKLKKARPGD